MKNAIIGAFLAVAIPAFASVPAAAPAPAPAAHHAAKHIEKKTVEEKKEDGKVISKTEMTTTQVKVDTAAPVAPAAKK